MSYQNTEIFFLLCHIIIIFFYSEFLATTAVSFLTINLMGYFYNILFTYICCDLIWIPAILPLDMARYVFPNT